MKRRGQPPAPKAKGKKAADEGPRKRICQKGAALPDLTRKRLGKAELAAARQRAQEVVETALLQTHAVEAALRKEAEEAEAAKRELQTSESFHAKATESAAAAQREAEESAARATQAAEQAAEARRRAEEAEAVAATAKREADERQEAFRQRQTEAQEAEQRLREEVLRGEAQRQAGDEAKRRRSQEENLLMFKLRSLVEQLGLGSHASKEDLVQALEQHLTDEGYEVKRPKVEPSPEAPDAVPSRDPQQDAEAPVAVASRDPQPDAEAGAAQVADADTTGPTSQGAAQAAPEEALPPSPVKATPPASTSDVAPEAPSGSSLAPPPLASVATVADSATTAPASTVVIVVEGGQFRVENTFPAEKAEAQQHSLRSALAEAAASLQQRKAEEVEAVKAHQDFVEQMEARVQAAKPLAQQAEESVKKAQEALRACDDEVSKVQRVKQNFEELYENPSDKAKTKIKALRTALKPYGLDEAQLQGLPEIMVKKKVKRTAKDKKLLTLIQETLAAQLKGRRNLSATCRSEVQKCQQAVDAQAAAARSRAEELQQAEAALRAKEAAHSAAEEEVSKAQKDLEEHEAKMTRAGILRFNSDAESCLICCDERKVDAAVMLGCGHGWYCPACINRFVEARLETGIAGDIPCPDCAKAISEEDLLRLLPKKTVFRLHASNILRRAVASGNVVRPCPTPDCLMKKAFPDAASARGSCPLCGHEACWMCGAQPYHEGLSCEEHRKKERARGDDDSFMKWMKETGTKQCPKCGMATSKENLDSQTDQVEECHKMLCRSCGTKFCFGCGAVLTETYTCGCTQNAHNFVDPHTGKLVKHLQKAKAKAKAKSR